MRLKRWNYGTTEQPATYDRTEIVHGTPGSGQPGAPSCILTRSDEDEIRQRIDALDEDQLRFVVEYFALSARGWARSIEPDQLITAIATAETRSWRSAVTA